MQNGGFDDGASWTIVDPVERGQLAITGGKLTHDGVIGAIWISNAGTVTGGKSYDFTYTVDSNTTTGMELRIESGSQTGDGTRNLNVTPGTHTATFSPTNSGIVSIRFYLGTAGGAMTLDDFILRGQ